MKWGRQRYFKQQKHRKYIIELRQEWAKVCGFPYPLLFDRKPLTMEECKSFYNTLQELNVSLISAFDKFYNTKNLPRKLKKQLKNKHREMRHSLKRERRI